MKYIKTKIGTLVSKGALNIPIIFFEKETPKFTYEDGSGYTYGPYTIMPELKPFILTTCTNGGRNTLFIQAASIPNNNKDIYFYMTSLYLPASYEIGVLIDEDKEQVFKDHQAFEMKHLSSNLRHNFITGSDPEIFIETETGTIRKRQKLLPAFEFLGSKVEKKHSTAQGMHIYWDGFQAEFETLPAGCLEGHANSVHHGLKAVINAAKKHNKNARLSTKTTIEVSQKILHESKEEHIALGCMPSYNIYGLEGRVVSDPRDLTVRSAGGHIHFGIGQKSKEEIEQGVKALDKILGVACVALFANFDNPVRRLYYGLPGEYRLPPHGLEYRTLSNAWLCHPLIMHIVFGLARKALVFGLNGHLNQWQATEEETIQCILECNVAKAREIMDRNKELLLKILNSQYHYNEGAKELEVLYSVFYNGIETAVSDPSNIEHNWCLDQANLSASAPGRTFRYAKENLIKGKKAA